MKVFSCLMIWACLIVLLSECPNPTTFIVSKLVASALIVVFGIIFRKNMSKEELNEEV